MRVWSTAEDFNVTLAQPLKMSSGAYEMVNAAVTVDTKALNFGSALTIDQNVAGVGGYDQVHELAITVDAPTKVGAVSTNGSYSGDLVMLFEPTPAP